MSDTAATPATPTSPAPPGTVCRKCWHGLKGIDGGSVCPECGVPIAASLDASWWGNHAAGPLARLAGSIGAFMWGCAVFFALFASVWALEVSSIKPPESGVVDTLLGLLLAGIWSWLTVSLLRALRAARAARFAGKWLSISGVIAAATSCLACAVAQTVSMLFPRVHNGWTDIAPIVFAGSSVLMLVSWALVQRRAASHIGRSPLRHLAWVQTGIALLLALVYVALMTGEVVKSRMASPPPWLYDVQEWLQTPTLTAITSLLLVTILNLVLMRRAIRQFLAARSAAA